MVLTALTPRSVVLRLEIGPLPRRDRSQPAPRSVRGGARASFFSGSRNFSISRHLGLRGPPIWMLTCPSDHPSGCMGGFEGARFDGTAGGRQLQALNGQYW